MRVCLLASATEGGWKRVVAGSSILFSPAEAVDKEMDGSDKPDAVIWGDGLLRSRCCWAAAADIMAAWAAWCSLFLGEVEKSWDNLLPLEEEGRRVEGFSEMGIAVEVELANGFRGSL